MIIAHQPVMVDEVIQHLITTPDGIYVDGTVGLGGHSLEICKCITHKGKLICLDIDRSSIGLAKTKLSAFLDRVTIIKESYVALDKVLKKIGITKVHGILLDLGVSSYQLESSGRGFSFITNEPLDMRMDEERDEDASKLVNNLSFERLEELLWVNAQERWAKVIARRIVEERKKGPINSSRQLALLIEAAIPFKHRSRKRHPATKTFQALRIAVNREIENLAVFLEKCPSLLVKGGRVVVISYHSLEDRIVKQAFHQKKKENTSLRKLPVLPNTHLPFMKALTKKGLRPDYGEVNINPRARSAIMRVAERT